jgi:hypothetical protein
VDRPSALDASGPSPLRLAGFLVTATGALLAGVGATLTWVTVGIEVAEQISTVTKGTDVWDGVVVLICALVMLVAVLATRMATSSRLRRAAATLVIGAGFIAFSVAGAFAMTASSRFEPVADDTLIAAIARAAEVPEDQIRATIDDVIDEVGAFTRVGPGPYLAIAGGLAGVIGGVLVLSWASKTPDVVEPAGADAPAGSDGPGA